MQTLEIGARGGRRNAKPFRDPRHKNASPQIAIRFDTETMKTVQTMAARENKSAALIIRRLVAAGLARS